MEWIATFLTKIGKAFPENASFKSDRGRKETAETRGFNDKE